jgi:sigma-B regulation protein RsbU (phosphoserine phosphatase)
MTLLSGLQHQGSIDPVITSVPVIGGRGYRSARSRLHQALTALRVGDVSASVAAAEFSRLYRSLPMEATVQIGLYGEGAWLHLSLETMAPKSMVTQLAEELVHFRSECLDAGAASSQLRLSHTYPLQVGTNLEQARQLLLKATAEELAREASLTQQALSHTQSRLSSVQEDLRIAAEIQQRMLVSRDRLKRIHPAIDCHAYMVPCRDIGGDFYDVINLDTDHIAVVVGDVSGKGITAAMMMATCMTLLRAYCESFRAPSRIMRKINPRLIEGNEVDCLFTTLFLAIINIQKNSLTYCNAGHNPALLQRSDGSIEELDHIHGPAVGVMDQVPYEQTRVTLNPGDRLLLYTDGASETFNGSGELYGGERLLNYCRKASLSLSSRKLLSGLLMDLNLFSGQELSHDDVTLVAVQRQRQREQRVVSSEHSAAATPEGMGAIMAASDAFCTEQQIEPSISGRLQLVQDELLVNVVSHGAGDGDETPTIRLLLRHLPDDHRLVVEIRDNGIPFNPFALAEPDTDLSIEERELGGLGIFFVRSLTRSFSYTHEPPWNCVLLEIDTLAEDDA